MRFLSSATLNAYRQETFHTLPANRIRTLEEAVNLSISAVLSFSGPFKG